MEGPFEGPDLSPTLWAELTEMDADLRAELLQHMSYELFQTPKLRCDNRARAQVCATAGAVTLACRTNRRRIGMPIERVEIAASRCASHARSSFFPTPRALRELYSVTRLTTACAAGFRYFDCIKQGEVAGIGAPSPIDHTR